MSMTNRAVVTAAPCSPPLAAALQTVCVSLRPLSPPTVGIVTFLQPSYPGPQPSTTPRLGCPGHNWNKTEIFYIRYIWHCQDCQDGHVCEGCKGFHGLWMLWRLSVYVCENFLLAMQIIVNIRHGDMWVPQIVTFVCPWNDQKVLSFCSPKIIFSDLLNINI